MMLVSTYIAPSAIEGVGVFAEDRIPAGTAVWRFDDQFDRVVGVDALDAMPEHFRAFFERYAYPLASDPSRLVLEVDNGRFMNHAEAPNTDFSVPYIGTALRDIAAGEELTCNYAELAPEYVLLPSFIASKAEAGHNGVAPV